MNTVVLTGNLTKDAQTKAGDDWQLATFTLAVNENKKVNGEWKTEANFIDVKTFSKKDFSVLVKGTPVLIEGKLHQDKWQTKDGKNASKIIVEARDFQVLASRKKQQPQQQSTQQSAGYYDDDVPF